MIRAPRTLAAITAVGLLVTACGTVNKPLVIYGPNVKHASQPQTLVVRNAFNQGVKLVVGTQMHDLAAGGTRNIEFVIVTQNPVSDASGQPDPEAQPTNDLVEKSTPKLIAQDGGRLTVMKPDGENEVVTLSLEECAPDWDDAPAKAAAFQVNLQADLGATVQLCPR